FSPPDEFRSKANASNDAIYETALNEREGFWAGWAEQLDWQTKWDKVLDWQPPYAKWFVGGKLNASHNCLDRHVATKPGKLAIVWEGEPGDVRSFTYGELHAEVSKFANALKK